MPHLLTGRAACACLALGALAAPRAQVPSEAPRPAIVVTGRDSDWDGIVPVSIPWPRGAHRDLRCVSIAGHFVPCAPVAHWRDGSVALVRAWPRLRVAAKASTELEVAPQPDAEPEASAAQWLFDGGLPLRTVVEDPWGERFVADFEPDASAGDGGWLARTPGERQRRFRAQHTAGDRAFLWLRAYLTERADGRAELTVLLDDDPPDGAIALGPIRFRSFTLENRDAELHITARYARENLVPPPERQDGVERHVLLAANDQSYLGDRTAKAFRFDLSRGRAAPPPLALPTLAWTRHTRAFGAHGGPAPVAGTPHLIAHEFERAWRQRARCGPFGDFGDPADAAAQGTPRNGPCALHMVVQLGEPVLLAIAEAQVLQHPLRPTPGHEPRRPAATAELRQGLSDRTIARPHGFTPLDYEHFSADLLYDYWWLTGDALARDELARLGRGLRPLLRGLPFATARGEGWCLQAAVLIARATGDAELVGFAHGRFNEEIRPQLGGDAALYAIRQPPHELAFGAADHAFDAPWQMAALVHGLAALYEATGDQKVAAAAVATARKMATSGWEEGTGPKYLLSAVDLSRYRMPVGFEPTEGTALFEVGAFVLAGELLAEIDPAADRSLLADRADALMSGRPPTGETASNRWFQLYLDRHR